MEIVDFFDSDNKTHWLSEIEKSEWRAGKYLYELLRNNKLKELCGESTKTLLLVDDGKLLSFCTYAERGDGLGGHYGGNGTNEVCPEEWSNRLIVTKLWVTEGLQGQGNCKRLMDKAKEVTKEQGRNQDE